MWHQCQKQEQGHCGACRRKWRLTDTDLYPCDKTQTMFHIVESCLLTNWMAAYLDYTLRMKTLFHGWPVVVHDTHTRRRSVRNIYFYWTQCWCECWTWLRQTLTVSVHCRCSMSYMMVCFSPTMLPSSPVVSLSSDTIDQLCRESVTGPDLVDLWSSWQKNVDAEMWPYNAMELWLVYTVLTCAILYQLILYFVISGLLYGSCILNYD